MNTQTYDNGTALQEDLLYPRWDIAREKAADLVSSYTSPIIPVLEIAENNGVDVVFTDFGEYTDSVAGFCDFANRKLYVNDRDPMTRKMFTIAHEFGHWILHRDFFLNNKEKYAVLPRFQRARTDPFEQEANAFAAELLAPTHLLRPVKEAGAARLAPIFGVSREMMEYRIKNV